jgi:hypothetical protein
MNSECSSQLNLPAADINYGPLGKPILAMPGEGFIARHLPFRKRVSWFVLTTGKTLWQRNVQSVRIIGIELWSADY